MYYLTSFFRTRELPADLEVYSAAVYQPDGYSFPKAEWADIRKDGRWIRPANFIKAPNPPMAYHDALMELYASRHDMIKDWCDAHPKAVLCCWCPRDRAAQRQLREFGSFICHTSVMGEYLAEVLHLPVWYDADRRTMMVLQQKGIAHPATADITGLTMREIAEIKNRSTNAS